MKLILIISLSLFGCLMKDSKPIASDDVIDESAQSLKNQLLKNYTIKEKKTIAIASFARTDLINSNSKYYSVIPKLGILYANSLQNEMFQPDKFDLLERQRIDGILKEIYYDRIGLTEEFDKNLKLIGADYILLGTLQKRESSIRIDARLVNTLDGKIVSVGTTTLPINTYTLNLYSDYPSTVESFKGTIVASDSWQPIYGNIDGNTEIDIEAEGQWSIITDINSVKIDAKGVPSNPYNEYLNVVNKYSKTISATEGWQNIYESIDEGFTEITIEAEGQWSMTNPNAIRMDAKGLDKNPSGWGDFRISKNFNHGALICQLDKKQDNFFSMGFSQISGIGNIQCRINDDDLKNNVGSLTVTLKVKRNSHPSSGDFRISKNFNYGALICRLNTKQNDIFSLGINKINGSGVVECRMNDDKIKSNIGSQSVTIKLKKIEK